MPANLVWGKEFRMEETTTPSGEPYHHVIGVGGGLAAISWSSVRQMESLAEQHGVSKQIWPIYRGYEIESEVPLKDAERRSAELRIALEGVEHRVIKEDYWLSFIYGLLRDGNSFFIMP